ncbi:Hsp90 co-chaperone Cdc37 [Trichinella pseudospiralis]|uniref:Hsp90 co-chaperone Cdc37 n=2 Tax=Trichinella pseudospiralis TaxID=6337 RepID=A0A0V1IX86_TRIPS|nr:Hsp90 co-chaperone Cdc37 [Trichinella pseudospiralis]KRY84366.1 Hsp90 co-chaperone Cdc37 [Trichinella pseudospiralis]KRZ27359.1 Hsp90 co-chaperone Cdc37 [Trichinella pseudospiralis]KRZ33545.1 Hsp90 co-chaperone Cdc37 [Trichinella pseudospiralis]
MPIDYSKWKDIEVSDDEDDLSPHFEKNAFFEMRHRERINRMEEEKQYDNMIEEKYKSVLMELEKLKEQQHQAGSCETEEEKKRKEEELQSELEELQLCKEEIAERQRKAKWNVDTISRPGFERTCISTASSDEVKVDFSEAENDALFKFSLMHELDDSMRILMHYPRLCDETALKFLTNQMVIVEVNGMNKLAENIAHQRVLLSCLLHNAKMQNAHPKDRSYIAEFFTCLKECPRTRATFNADVRQCIEELRDQMEQIRNSADKQPLDAKTAQQHVLESMPSILRKCFLNRDYGMLKQALDTVGLKLFQFHLNRAVRVGLWREGHFVPTCQTSQDDLS